MAHDTNLELALRSVAPGIRLVSERNYRRVLHYFNDRGRLLPTNTELALRVSRAELLAADLLPYHITAGDEPDLILITDADDRAIDDLPVELQLRCYWRVIYQEALAWEIARREQRGELTPGEVADRLRELGTAETREIRYVLEAEHYLPVGADDPALYRTFAATYLSLYHFEPHRLQEWFPSLPPSSSVLAILGRDCDPIRLLTQTRPDGAAESHDVPPPDEPKEPEPPAPESRPPSGSISQLEAHAARAERTGNYARLALVQTRLAAMMHGKARRRVTERAEGALAKLVDQLGKVFDWDEPCRQEWFRALKALPKAAVRDRSARAAWSLAELQKIGTELSRELYAVDLPEYLRTFGRSPIRRPLPHAQPVRILMTLKKAHLQMLRSTLGDSERQRLDELFRAQIDLSESHVRKSLTPVVREALTQAGLVPQNRVEEVAADKLVAELLDRVCERGYLRIGDLRDAIARNRLKLSDLSGIREFVKGDALLRADEILAVTLDGVYRRGEVYLRVIQRLSALFFGTAFGRALTLYLGMPFGGAFLVLMFLEELRHILGRFLGFGSHGGVGETPAYNHMTKETDPSRADQFDLGEEAARTAVPDDEILTPHDEIFTPPLEHVANITTTIIPSLQHHEEHPHSWLVATPTIIGTGIFLLFLIHSPRFRFQVLDVLDRAGKVFRHILWDYPHKLWHSPWVRALRQNHIVRFLFRHFWNPLLLTLLLTAALLLVGVKPGFLWRWGWVMWAGLTLAYNTPWGWLLQDRVAEAIADWWRVVRVNLLPGLFSTIMDGFRRLVGWVERLLYTIDEWFRYRGGDSQVSIVVKAVLGLVWFPIAYIFRFGFNLLVEPQINPIKHFPVVTVSHKLMLPMVVYKPGQPDPTPLGEILVDQFGWAVEQANFWAFWGIAAVPGVFGFIAWELVANWQLYRANSPARIRAVSIGSHGETMRGLLRPGFHSGTIPKAYRKLRRASPLTAGRWHHNLHHVAIALERFVERELIPLLQHDPRWAKNDQPLTSVRLGCQRVQFELCWPAIAADPLRLTFENIGGVIEASIECESWRSCLSAEQMRVLETALAGFLDMACAERVDGLGRGEDPPAGVPGAILARTTLRSDWVRFWGAAIGSVSTHRR